MWMLPIGCHLVDVLLKCTWKNSDDWPLFKGTAVGQAFYHRGLSQFPHNRLVEKKSMGGEMSLCPLVRPCRLLQFFSPQKSYTLATTCMCEFFICCHLADVLLKCTWKKNDDWPLLKGTAIGQALLP